MARRRPTDRYPTDPASAQSSGQIVLPGSMFDQDRLRDAARRGLLPNAIADELDYPNDELLIATVVALGMPRWSADQMRYHPQLRYAYLALWLDVKMAAEGDKPAQARVDAVRARFVDERAAERISNVPAHATGYVSNPT